MQYRTKQAIINDLFEVDKQSKVKISEHGLSQGDLGAYSS